MYIYIKDKDGFEWALSGTHTAAGVTMGLVAASWAWHTHTNTHTHACTHTHAHTHTPTHTYVILILYTDTCFYKNKPLSKDMCNVKI